MYAFSKSVVAAPQSKMSLRRLEDMEVVGSTYSEILDGLRFGGAQWIPQHMVLFVVFQPVGVPSPSRNL